MISWQREGWRTESRDGEREHGDIRASRIREASGSSSPDPYGGRQPVRRVSSAREYDGYLALGGMKTAWSSSCA